MGCFFVPFNNQIHVEDGIVVVELGGRRDAQFAISRL